VFPLRRRREQIDEPFLVAIDALGWHERTAGDARPCGDGRHRAGGVLRCPLPCSIKLLKAPKNEASFHDFDEFERLVEVARSEALALLVVLLGGEAGLRCGEIMALEWTDIDFAKRQLTVARSEWKGHVTMPKGGRLRYVPLTRRLTEALRETRHLRGPRVLCDGTGKPLTQKVIQVLVRRTARRANVKPGIHIPAAHVLFAPGDARGAGKSNPGAGRTSGPRHDAALHAPQSGGTRRGNSVVGTETSLAAAEK
jgi:integrase